MRHTEFKTPMPNQSEQTLSVWEVIVKARTQMILCPFKDGKINITFPLLNASVSEPTLVIIDNGDFFQTIEFTLGISIFAANRLEAKNEILNATLVTVEGQDGQLNLVEPEIIILGEISHIC
ncbi:hypothetical protein [Terasakiella sp.]|uniref:hypothetical protein n=1 Tax=Terasakiella sp. TaxID=2034861 RepID=UPI003AA838EF